MFLITVFIEIMFRATSSLNQTTTVRNGPSARLSLRRSDANSNYSSYPDNWPLSAPTGRSPEGQPSIQITPPIPNSWTLKAPGSPNGCPKCKLHILSPTVGAPSDGHRSKRSTYIYTLVDVALVDDGFHFPNARKYRLHVFGLNQMFHAHV